MTDHLPGLSFRVLRRTQDKLREESFSVLLAGLSPPIACRAIPFRECPVQSSAMDLEFWRAGRAVELYVQGRFL
jgi:hypothetical protein